MNAPALLATHQLRQREYLLRITRAMTMRLDLPSLLRLILNSAAELVDCRAGLVVLARTDPPPSPPTNHTNRFQVRATYGITPDKLPAFQPLLDVPPILQESDDADAAPQLDPYFADLQARVREVEANLGTPLGQVVGLPLLVEEDLLGIIYLFRGEQAFTSLDWQFLQGFADQAAVAVRNARLYQQLARERSRFATIIQKSADGILILDPDRRVLVMNQSMAQMTGIEMQMAAGMRCRDLLVLENVRGVDLCDAPELPDFDATGEFYCEGDIVQPGKRRISVAITYTPIYSDGGQLLNIIVNVHDITRFREEEEIKSTFTSIISHELKTPVALIKGYAQTLARPDAVWDQETARQSLEIIEEEADRLESLINNLLDVSRIQAGGLSLEFADVNLNVLIQKIVAAWRTQTDRHTLQIDIPAPLPAIWGDEERLRQVLANLISNAIKYSPEGGAIRVGGWSDRKEGRERVVLYVADQGIGVPLDELETIFHPFYRVDSTLRRGAPGAGLGLFLSRAIVDANNGEIWARSEPGRGTTFFVALPVAPDEPTEDDPARTVTRTVTFRNNLPTAYVHEMKEADDPDIITIEGESAT